MFISSTLSYLSLSGDTLTVTVNQNVEAAAPDALMADIGTAVADATTRQ